LQLRSLLPSDLSRGFVAMPLEYPALVVGSLEFKERLAEPFGIPERAQPKEILFEDPHKSLGAAIALRLMDKSRRGLDAKESKFLLKSPDTN